MLPLAKSPLWTPLFALDRLNSWLRSEQPILCPFRSALKPVIYWTKTKAILDTSKVWHIAMRRVMVKKPCRKCNATGIFLPWYWDPPDGDYKNRNGGRICWGCQGTGTATLQFIETTIGPLRWHTPAEKWYFASLDVYIPFPCFYGDRNNEQYYELTTDWEPNQKGRPLPLPDVERDILILLNAFPHHVSFALDFHHHVGIAKHYRFPNLRKAQAWLHDLFHPTEPTQFNASTL